MQGTLDNVTVRKVNLTENKFVLKTNIKFIVKVI